LIATNYSTMETGFIGFVLFFVLQYYNLSGNIGEEYCVGFDGKGLYRGCL